MTKNNLSLCVALGLGAFACAPDANAGTLRGACYDYASRTSSTSTTIDFKSGAQSLANNLIGMALEDHAVLGVAYPLLYDTVTDSLSEESSEGADPDLVGCLQQFESRISSLEVNQLNDELAEFENIIDKTKRYVDNDQEYKHGELADDFAAFANVLGYMIRTRFDDMEAGHGTVDIYNTLVNSTIPAFVTAIQMTFLHRAEFDNWCQNLPVAPYWNGLGNDNIASYQTLSGIYDNTAQIEDLLTRENNQSYTASCSLGSTTFGDFMKVKSGLWGETLKQIGLEVVENTRNPGLISVKLNFTDAKLARYRESFINNCENNKFKDEYQSHVVTRNCHDFRDVIFNQLRNDSLLSPTSLNKDVKATLYDLAHIVDTWDLNNLVHSHNELTSQAGDIDFNNAVRLKHGAFNACIDQSVKLTQHCGTGANHFIFEPYGDGYSIMRAQDARYFKDKGDALGFRIYSDRGADATWYLGTPDHLGRYQIRNKSTDRCLVLAGDALSVGRCSGKTWEINGSQVPVHTKLVRLRDTSSNVCLSKDCDSNSYEFFLSVLGDGYQVLRHQDKAYLKDKGSIVLSSSSPHHTVGSPHGVTHSLDSDSVWYVVDKNGDNKVALRNKQTKQCLASANGNVVSSSCGSESEVWTFDYAAPPVGQLLLLEDDPNDDGESNAELQCLSRPMYWYGDQAYGMDRRCDDNTNLALESYEGGYLLLYPYGETYMADQGANVYDPAGLSTVTSPSAAATWDFIGPYDNGKFQVRNRSTGKCLKSHRSDNGGYYAVVIKCNDASSKAWIYYTTPYPYTK